MSGRAEPHVVIVGAGLAGALLACLFGKRGWRVDLVERRPDPRAAGFIGGRSINLALSTRGLTALARAGLDARVLETALPMGGRIMHDTAGVLSFQPYSSDPADAINSVSRGGLNLTLLEAASELPTVSMHFERRCRAVDLDAPSVTAEGPNGAVEVYSGDVVIGADGAFSAVRSAMQFLPRFDYSQTFLAHGYKELCIPPTEEGAFALDPKALHIWPRGGSMMIALPNQDRTFTVTLFWPFSGPGGLETLDTPEKITAHFERVYPDAVPLLTNLVEEYQENPTSPLVTVRCTPWNAGRSVILGDAAHAIVPFYGQGMNAAFEDCRILDELVDAHGGTAAPDWDAILPAFSATRVPNANAIADLALQNFIEMRDLVGSRWFRFQKRLGQWAHKLFPERWEPLYHMVSFSNRPYAEALGRARARVRTSRRAAVAGLAVVAVVGALGIGVWIG